MVSFSDFYDIDTIRTRQKGLSIITMEQFLEREALNGHLKSKVDGEAIYPPGNQIRWDNHQLSEFIDMLKKCVCFYLSSISLPNGH